MEISHFCGLVLKLNFSLSFRRVTISLLKIFRLWRCSFPRVIISLDQKVIIFVTQIDHESSLWEGQVLRLFVVLFELAWMASEN